MLWDTRGGGSDMLLDWAVDSGMMEVGINDAGSFGMRTLCTAGWWSS